MLYNELQEWWSNSIEKSTPPGAKMNRLLGLAYMLSPKESRFPELFQPIEEPPIALVVHTEPGRQSGQAIIATGWRMSFDTISGNLTIGGADNFAFRRCMSNPRCLEYPDDFLVTTLGLNDTRTAIADIRRSVDSLYRTAKSNRTRVDRSKVSELQSQEAELLIAPEYPEPFAMITNGNVKDFQNSEGFRSRVMRETELGYVAKRAMEQASKENRWNVFLEATDPNFVDQITDYWQETRVIYKVGNLLILPYEFLNQEQREAGYQVVLDLRHLVTSRPPYQSLNFIWDAGRENMGVALRFSGHWITVDFADVPPRPQRQQQRTEQEEVHQEEQQVINPAAVIVSTPSV